MNSFGLTPGSRVGELLEKAREAEAACEVSTREEALALIRKLLMGSNGDARETNDHED
jgi:hypothetical protein